MEGLHKYSLSDNHIKIFANYISKLDYLIPESLSDLFKSANAKLYAVGGCVRDALLGKTPKDIDLCTNLTPSEVIDLCSKNNLRVIPTGIDHGTVTIMIDNEPYEVTTFRMDVAPDGRHSIVEFVSDVEEDLSRRDFTINAMAVDKFGNIIDPFGGQKDLANMVIKAVGNPNDRFKEDYLRIIRAARFAARYNFKIEENTHKAMINNSKDLINEMNINKNGGKISMERVSEEISKAFNSNNSSEFINILYSLNILQNISNDFDSSTVSKILQCIDNVSGQDRWYILFVFINSNKIENIFRTMRLPLNNINLTIKIAELRPIFERLVFSSPSERDIREFQTLCDKDLHYIYKIYSAIYKNNPMVDIIFQEIPKFEQIIQGRDIISLFPNRKPGQWVGELLRFITDYHKKYFYDNGENPSKEHLMDLIINQIKE
jgi:tRNA nucleotidyltransferase/poly(A) polymerase